MSLAAPWGLAALLLAAPLTLWYLLRSRRPAVVVPSTLLWRGTTGLGITVNELSPQLAEYFGTSEGVLVSAVTDDSAAARAGLRAGDVVTAFNGTSVSSAAQLRRELQQLRGGEEFSLEVVRDKNRLTLKGKMEEVRGRSRTFRTVI